LRWAALVPGVMAGVSAWAVWRRRRRLEASVAVVEVSRGLSLRVWFLMGFELCQARDDVPHPTSHSSAHHTHPPRHLLHRLPPIPRTRTTAPFNRILPSSARTYLHMAREAVRGVAYCPGDDGVAVDVGRASWNRESDRCCCSRGMVFPSVCEVGAVFGRMLTVSQRG
jgi:hypothetical protein